MLSKAVMGFLSSKGISSILYPWDFQHVRSAFEIVDDPVRGGLSYTRHALWVVPWFLSKGLSLLLSIQNAPLTFPWVFFVHHRFTVNDTLKIRNTKMLVRMHGAVDARRRCIIPQNFEVWTTKQKRKQKEQITTERKTNAVERNPHKSTGPLVSNGRDYLNSFVSGFISHTYINWCLKKQEHGGRYSRAYFDEQVILEEGPCQYRRGLSQLKSNVSSFQFDDPLFGKCECRWMSHNTLIKKTWCKVRIASANHRSL